jgi:hypothetical protein
MISAGQEKNIKKLFTSKTHLNSPQNIDSMKNDDNTGS